MHIYNSTTLSFIKKIKARSLEILSQEAGFLVKRSRINFRGYLYPLEFVVFEDQKTLGYFDSKIYRIGINKLFINNYDEETLDNVLRHELAHFITYLHYGDAVQNHGNEYRSICKNFNWNEEVYSAKLDLKFVEENLSEEDEKVKILNRIKKLYALASSSNVHESQLATSKANEMLKKYNLKSLSNEIEEETCLLKVIEAKRMNTKIEMIYEILGHFYVRPIMNKGKGSIYLEVIGSRLNVELAKYTADFLDLELDRFWKACKKENPELKGTVAKNSYLRGLTQGFIEKIQTQSENSPTHNKAAGIGEVMVLENQLERMVGMVYPRLRSSKVLEKQNCSAGQKLGLKDAKNFNIRPGVKNESKGNLRLI